MTAEAKPTLNQRQSNAVLALLAHPTIVEAAAAVGCSEKSIRQWLKLPLFVAELNAARRAARAETVNRLQALTSEAIATLHRNLNCKMPAVEVRAAAEILDRAAGLGELSELADQLADLTEKLTPRATTG